MLAFKLRKTLSKSGRLWHAVLALCLCLGPLISGCGQAEQGFSSSPALAGLEAGAVTHRGKLQFVADTEAGCLLAKEKSLPCLMFFTAEWCTYCHQMEEAAFTDPDVVEMADNFICVIVDADREQDVCTQFSVSGFPTIQFVSPSGRALNRLVGRQSSQDLIAGMRAALKRFAWLDDSATKVR